MVGFFGPTAGLLIAATAMGSAVVALTGWAWLVGGSIAALAGLHFGAFLLLRVQTPLVPIGLLEILATITVVGALRTSTLGRLRPAVVVASLAILVVTGVAIVSGLAFDQPPYNITKAARTMSFLAAGIVAGGRMHAGGRITLVSWALVAGGMLSALSQIVTFLALSQGIDLSAMLGIALTPGAAVDLDVPDIAASGGFRDLGVPISAAVVALAVVWAWSMSSRSELTRLQVAAIAPVLAVGAILSLTRAVWLALVMVIVILGWLATARIGRRIRSLAWVSLGTLVGVSAAFVVGLRLDPITTRLGQFGSLTDDAALRDRVSETATALRLIGSNWLSGIGAADVPVIGPDGMLQLRNSTHDGYLYYFMLAGAIGLIALVATIVLALLNSYRASRRTDDSERWIAVAVFAGISVWAFLSLGSGGLASAPNALCMGLLVGIALDLRLDRTAGSTVDPQSGLEARRRCESR